MGFGGEGGGSGKGVEVCGLAVVIMDINGWIFGVRIGLTVV